jgi:hypothetical protein
MAVFRTKIPSGSHLLQMLPPSHDENARLNFERQKHGHGISCVKITSSIHEVPTAGVFILIDY